jgi:hypothetical protein
LLISADGIMALFGAPIAHEDSPRRAVHAALGIQRALRDVAQTLQAERGLSLQMRMSLNTGLVVVGKIGDNLRMDYTAVGDTTNLKAEGVPLFIEEVTKALLDLGLLRRENNSYRLVKRLSQVRVPETIQEIIMARLDRLGDDGKRTVQLASVIGRQFLVRLLARVAGLTDRLDGLLRELQALEIIYEQGLLPEPAYSFKHAVIQDVAYNSLLVQRRKALHQIVGDAIEELYHDRLEEHYPELTHHFSQGEVWDKAFFYWRQAGARAFTGSALREALVCVEQALAALHHLPESQGTCEQAIDLRLEMRNVLIALGDFGRMFELLCEAEALAKTLEDQRRWGWVSAYLNPLFLPSMDMTFWLPQVEAALAPVE